MDSDKTPQSGAHSCWERLVSATKDASILRYRLQTEYRESLPYLIRTALPNPRGRRLALELTADLPEGQRKELLADVLRVAVHDCGEITLARELVLGLPREWLGANIERAAEAMLQDGDADDYRGFIDLLAPIDPRIALRIARRASEHPDDGVRAVGLEFLSAAGQK